MHQWPAMIRIAIIPGLKIKLLKFELSKVLCSELGNETPETNPVPGRLKKKAVKM